MEKQTAKGMQSAPPGVQVQGSGEPKIRIDLQSEFARKYQMDSRKSFLKQRTNSRDIEISDQVRLPGPLPDPEQSQDYRRAESGRGPNHQGSQQLPIVRPDFEVSENRKDVGSLDGRTREEFANDGRRSVTVSWSNP